MARKTREEKKSKRKEESDSESENEDFSSPRSSPRKGSGMSGRSAIKKEDYAANLATTISLVKDMFDLTKKCYKSEVKKFAKGYNGQSISKAREPKEGVRGEYYFLVYRDSTEESKNGKGETILKKTGKSGTLISKKALEDMQSGLMKYLSKFSSAALKIKSKSTRTLKDGEIATGDRVQYISDVTRDFFLNLSYGNGFAFGFSKVKEARVKMPEDDVRHIRRFLEMDGNNEKDRERLLREFRENGRDINSQYTENLMAHGFVDSPSEVTELRDNDVNFNEKLRPLLSKNVITKNIALVLINRFFAFTKQRKSYRVELSGSNTQFKKYLENKNALDFTVNRKTLSGDNPNEGRTLEEVLRSYKSKTKGSENMKEGYTKQTVDRKEKKSEQVKIMNDKGMHANAILIILSYMLINKNKVTLTSKQEDNLKEAQDLVEELKVEVDILKHAYKDADKYLTEKAKSTKKPSSSTKKSKSVRTLGDL